MMSLTFALFTQVSGLGPLGPLVSRGSGMTDAKEENKEGEKSELYQRSTYLFIIALE